MAYKVRSETLNILPPGSPEIRILHFSDLHLTPRRKTEISDIKTFASLEPDLVISTGDFLAHRNAVPVVLDALSGLLKIPGLYVFGSNDYYEPTFKNPLKYLMKDDGKRKLGKELPWIELDKSLGKHGWFNLNTKKEIITIKGVKIEVRSTDDAHLHRDNYSLVQGAKQNNVDLSIGVTHAPYKRILDAMANDQVDIIFAGHTHGGQIRIPWVGGSKALTTNCDLPLWRSRGLTRDGNATWLNVSSGMGSGPYSRLRILTPPEITFIKIRGNNNVK